MTEDLLPEDVPDDLLQLYGRNYNGTSTEKAERSALAAVLTVVRRQHAEELERLRLAADPTKVAAVGKLVSSATKLVRIERDDARADRDSWRERAETAEELAADYARIVARLQDAADRARALAGEHSECDDPCWEHMPAIVAALDASLPPEEEK